MPGPPAAVSESLTWLCVVGLGRAPRGRGRAARACRVRRRRYLARVAHSICRTSRTKRTSRCVLQFWIAPRTAVASLRPFRKREARSAEARPDRRRCGYVKPGAVGYRKTRCSEPPQFAGPTTRRESATPIPIPRWPRKRGDTTTADATQLSLTPIGAAECIRRRRSCGSQPESAFPDR